jgi:hypothetical protein
MYKRRLRTIPWYDWWKWDGASLMFQSEVLDFFQSARNPYSSPLPNHWPWVGICTLMPHLPLTVFINSFHSFYWTSQSMAFMVLNYPSTPPYPTLLHPSLPYSTPAYPTPPQPTHPTHSLYETILLVLKPYAEVLSLRLTFLLWAKRLWQPEIVLYSRENGDHPQVFRCLKIAATGESRP